jgi:hypothetical protein
VNTHRASLLFGRNNISEVLSGLLEIPDDVDMIVLQEVDFTETMREFQGEQSSMSLRQRRTKSQEIASPFLRRALPLQDQLGNSAQANSPQSTHVISKHEGHSSFILRTVQFSCQTYVFDSNTGAVALPQRVDGVDTDRVSSSESDSESSHVAAHGLVASVRLQEENIVQQQIEDDDDELQQMHLLRHQVTVLKARVASLEQVM